MAGFLGRCHSWLQGCLVSKLLWLCVQAVWSHLVTGTCVCIMATLVMLEVLDACLTSFFCDNQFRMFRRVSGFRISYFLVCTCKYVWARAGFFVFVFVLFCFSYGDGREHRQMMAKERCTFFRTKNILPGFTVICLTACRCWIASIDSLKTL